LTALETSLKDIESLLKNEFGDGIVWEQKSSDFVGKYIYMKYNEDEVGFFLGYVIDGQAQIKTCVSSIFPHPSVAMHSNERVNIGRRKFYAILIRANLKLKKNQYRMLTGRKLPALIRTLALKAGNFDNNEAIEFFKQSVSAVKESQPVPKILQ
jgi:hypothetical protein